MTSPTAPGSVPPPMDDTARRIRNLEARVDELTRRDLSNAQVGQGGRLRGLYSNGAEAFQFGRDPVDGENKATINYSGGTRAFGIGPGAVAYGSQEQLRINDLSGSPVLITDELAGYGLSVPNFPMLLNGWEETDLTGATTSATAASKATGYSYAYNPALHFYIRLRLRDTTASTFNARVRATLPDSSIIESTDTVYSVGANVINIRFMEKIILLPPEAMGQQIQADVMVWNSSGANGAVQAVPQLCHGVAKSFYDGAASLH